MFGELLGAWLAERWLAMGRPRAGAAGRAGPRPRHADGRCAARHARRRRLPCRARPPSRRDQRRGCAPLQRPALADFEPTWHDALRRRAGRPAAAGRQRVLRRPAGPPVREDAARLGRTHGRPGAPTARRCAWRWRPASRPSPRCCPMRRPAPRPSSREAGRALAAAIGARLRRDGGWALIVDYGYDAQRPRRLAAGRARPSRRGHPRSARRDRPQRPCRFRRPRRAPPAVPTFGPVGQGDFLRRLGIAAACSRH